MALLECSGICKAFALGDRKLSVLEDVSFAVEPGEVVVLVGKSGCGKSTLLRILAGLLAPDAGTVLLEGKPLRAPTPRISILFQSYTVFPWMSVRGNVEAGLVHRGLPRRERRRIAAAYLELVGLAEFAEARPSRLSGGMQQRVALARTYAMDPKVLLMDEPFGALDAFTRRDMQQELLRINSQEHKSVVFVTHDIEEAVLLASRILVLSSLPARVFEVFGRDETAGPGVLHQRVADALQRAMNSRTPSRS
jgi:NitT/TauT family transport system ATP-binding protein